MRWPCVPGIHVGFPTESSNLWPGVLNPLALRATPPLSCSAPDSHAGWPLWAAFPSKLPARLGQGRQWREIGRWDESNKQGYFSSLLVQVASWQRLCLLWFQPQPSDTVTSLPAVVFLLISALPHLTPLAFRRCDLLCNKCPALRSLHS